jgi:hypothetical protein
MITGFNTDVEFSGCVYHVQTEDRGLDNPIIESLVYTGGEIVASRKTPYADLIASGCYSEDALVKRMESQHRELMGEIRHGKFSGEETRKPFGHAIVTNRSFDEVVASFLRDEIEAGRIRVDGRERPTVNETPRPSRRATQPAAAKAAESAAPKQAKAAKVSRPSHASAEAKLSSPAEEPATPEISTATKASPRD